MPEILAAVALGIVEGLTEFIPVSSTGHLILFGKAISFNGASAKTFSIFIQLGAILAVVILYWHRFRALLISSPNSPAGFSGKAGIIKLLLACIPVFISGYLFHDAIKALLEPLPVAAALICGGIFMLMVDRGDKNFTYNSLEEISYKTAFLIGVFQCAALWPGMSRSGSTIIGAMLLGVERRVAAEFSFLVAVPVMVAAVGYDMLKSYHELTAADIDLFAVGFVVSLITAVVAIKFFMSLLSRYTLIPFGWYRICLGLFVLGLLGN